MLRVHRAGSKLNWYMTLSHEDKEDPPGTSLTPPEYACFWLLKGPRVSWLGVRLLSKHLDLGAVDPGDYPKQVHPLRPDHLRDLQTRHTKETMSYIQPNIFYPTFIISSSLLISS